jgi:hypothetical protein
MATFQPDEASGIDTFNSGVNQTTNYGTDASFYIGMASGQTLRGLLKFDLSTIPTGTQVASANLYLNCATYSIAATLKVHKILLSWVEAEETYQKRYTGVNWTSNGLGSGTDYTASEMGTIGVSASGIKTIPLDITTVQDWINTPANNCGMLLKNETEATNYNLWSTSTDATASLRPKLVLEIAASGASIAVCDENGMAI